MVPRSTPCSVAAVVPSEADGGKPGASLLNPKSKIFTKPSFRIITFLGFKSRCTIPDSCATAKPAPICLAMSRTSCVGIAPAAKQQGRYVAECIKARLRGETIAPFHYQHAGSLAQIGKRQAVIDFGRFKLRGTLAWWIWGIAHIYFLIGIRNRLSVAMSWLWIHARDQRAARLITQGSSKVVR